MKYPEINELHELWDTIAQHVTHKMVAAEFQNIFTDIIQLLSNHKKLNTVKIIVQYVASYPSSYSTVAAKLNLSKKHVLSVLNREARNMPWLYELMLQQSVSFYKGDITKTFRHKSDGNVTGKVVNY